ncbi:hypothetical protein ACQ4PT_019484 [Festuca glaucescens]
MGRHAKTRHRCSRKQPHAQAGGLGYTECDADDGPTKRRPPLGGKKSCKFKASLSEQNIRGQRGGEDCSHWCLPGVPDTWNELLYALFMRRQMKLDRNDTDSDSRTLNTD